MIPPARLDSDGSRAVIPAEDAETIYEVPLKLAAEGFDELVLEEPTGTVVLRNADHEQSRKRGGLGIGSSPCRRKLRDRPAAAGEEEDGRDECESLRNLHDLRE